MLTQKVGFIGAGRMASALARGFVDAKLVPGSQIVAADPVRKSLKLFTDSVPGSQSAESNQSIIETADIVFLSVKPQHLCSVMDEVHCEVVSEKLIISIVAGIPLSKLTQGLKTERVVRVMPNTPCLVGLSASAYSFAPGATPEDREIVSQLLSAVGIAFPVEEKLLDAVTGLSGSGPAFIYVAIEALSDGGVRMGLPREIATALATQTVLGAAKMVQTTQEHPAILKDQVASPGGTTIAGLQALEDKGLRSALIAAVEEATKRSIELGQASL